MGENHVAKSLVLPSLFPIFAKTGQEPFHFTDENTEAQSLMQPTCSTSPSRPELLRAGPGVVTSHFLSSARAGPHQPLKPLQTAALVSQF